MAHPHPVSSSCHCFFSVLVSCEACDLDPVLNEKVESSSQIRNLKSIRRARNSSLPSICSAANAALSLGFGYLFVLSPDGNLDVPLF
jgi:hypothetical protein